MAARITYRNEVAGGSVTLVAGSTAEAAYRRDRRWVEVARVDIDVAPLPERLKPGPRAEAKAAAADVAVDHDAEVVVDGSVGDVKAAVEVGGPGLAVAVLALEQERKNPRSTLVAWLTEQAGDLAVPAPSADLDEGEGEAPDPGDQPDALVADVPGDIHY